MISWQEILLRLGLAAFFGAIIGIERERKEWAAGLRTHMMVCLGASLIMIVSAYGFSDVLQNKNVTLDPSRIAAQVISGIGFIGAGTILFLRDGIIRGLTTAAGLWTVAAIGLATGGGMYVAAVIATLLAIIILWLLQPVEKIFSPRFKHNNLKIVTGNKDKTAGIISRIIETNGLEVLDFVLNRSENDFVISFKFKSSNPSELTALLNEFHADSDIKEVIWNN